MAPVKYTYDICFAHAGLTSGRLEWALLYNSSYQAAGRNGWREKIAKELGWPDGPREYAPVDFTYEICLERAKPFKSIKEYRREDQGAYRAAAKNRWVVQIAEALGWKIPKQTGRSINIGNRNGAVCMRKPRGYWTYENVVCDARQYPDPQVWREQSKSYGTASLNDWSSKIVLEVWGVPEGYTEEFLRAAAKKTSHLNRWINTRAGLAAKELGILDELIVSRNNRQTIKWTYELCLAKALEHQTLFDFRTKEAKAYDAALRRKWIDQIKVERGWSKTVLFE